MIKKNSEDNPVLVINTTLQKKNDKNIQNFLNKYKHYEENPEYLKNTGEHVNLIISHKSTIPDLVIYNQVFNKNECFFEANKNEKNYFPRHSYYIKFEGDEKLISKGVKNSKNEEIKEKEEENFDDDEEEDEEGYENENNMTGGVGEKQIKINNVSNVEINSIMSNNNSMYNEINNLPNNNNISLFSTNSTLRNFNENSLNYEDNNNYSYSSRVMNNIKSYIEPKNDENSFSQQTNYQQKNNFQNYQNFQNSNFNNSFNINNNYNINNNFNNNFNNNIINNNNQSFTGNENNKIVNMFSKQIELLDLINQKMKNNINGNNEEINELKKDIIKLVILGPDGNIIGKMMNFEEMLDYITNNILDKNKFLEKYNIYIIDTEEKIKGKEFYFPIISFCVKNIKFK